MFTTAAVLSGRHCRPKPLRPLRLRPVTPPLEHLAVMHTGIRAGVPGYCLAPLQRHSVGFDESAVPATITPDRHRNKGGINDLATFEFDTQVNQHL